MKPILSQILRIVVATAIVAALLAAGWVWLTLHWVYSEGERTGYVQKLSKKGWVCKTWEGEIVLVTMPGAIPEKFEFTVRDEDMVARLNAAAGSAWCCITSSTSSSPPPASARPNISSTTCAIWTSCPPCRLLPCSRAFCPARPASRSRSSLPLRTR